MNRLIISVSLILCCVAPALAQQCLHESDETLEQQARRQQALRAARLVNTIQANQPGQWQRRYLNREELAAAPYVLEHPDSIRPLNLLPGQAISPGWELVLNVTTTGYWFMIRDKTDACGFAFISNTNGVIYRAEPIR